MTQDDQQASVHDEMLDHRLVRARIEKAEALRARGVDPYPTSFRRSHTTGQALQLFGASESDLKQRGASEEALAALRTEPVRIAGRVMARRGMGKMAFLDIRDGDGTMQAQLRSDNMGEDFQMLEFLDLGDFVGVDGPVFRTRSGEITVEAREFTMLSKAIRPLPDKWAGLKDPEVRHRQRYLDLIANENAMRNVRTRSAAVAAMREFMHERGFIEVETPILVPVAAGAQARPFTTHHNSLNRDLYLRIATELYLKKLIVGGIEKVFEIGRLFRNEGVDHDHNPEFTTMESYETYADYRDVMKMVEELVSAVALKVTGSVVLPATDHRPEIDLTPPWPRLDLRGEIIKRTGIDFLEAGDVESLSEAMRQRSIHVEPGATWGRLLDKIISSAVEPELIQPAFMVDYPVEMSPLAKRKPGTDRIVERFEAFVLGSELANAFTELNDPVDQRARFEEQERLRLEFKDDEADRLDEDFLVAVEHGMPPTGGLGIGVDRLAMLLAGERSIREVILFPQLRN